MIRPVWGFACYWLIQEVNNMGKQYFGTDGIRGVANSGALVPEFMLKLANAAAIVFPRNSGKVLIGRDSRKSGDMLQAALTAGLLSQGFEVHALGVIPTPAVSYLTATEDYDFGIMISASHNPVEDNGIKFFNRDGYKLSDEMEIQLEFALSQESDRADFAAMRPYVQSDELMEKYLNHHLSLLNSPLNGLKIVCDTAWGAAAPWAEKLYKAAGADVVMLNNEPNGDLINVNCGSTNTAALQAKVKSEKADLGLAFDGDADRLIVINELGEEMDGDELLYIFTAHLAKEKKLKNAAVVGTVMTNMGLEVALQESGIKLVRAKVGDRYVWEQMQELDLVLGGEQSGHIINKLWQLTGDGMLNGLMLADILHQKGGKLSELRQGYKLFPQLLINVPVLNKKAVMQHPALLALAQEVEKELQGKGRLVLRQSGTEELIRVMVEAVDMETVRFYAEKVAEQVRSLSNVV